VDRSPREASRSVNPLSNCLLKLFNLKQFNDPCSTINTWNNSKSQLALQAVFWRSQGLVYQPRAAYRMRTNVQAETRRWELRATDLAAGACSLLHAFYFRCSSLFSMARSKAPSTKHQAPSSREAPILKLQSKARAMWMAIEAGALKFGTWNFFGAWSLGFEASQTTHSTETCEEPLLLRHPVGIQGKGTLPKPDLRRPVPA
jgi:hypothetical protein